MDPCLWKSVKNWCHKSDLKFTKIKRKKNNYDVMATPKRCNVVTSQTPMVSMTTRLIVSCNFIYNIRESTFWMPGCVLCIQAWCWSIHWCTPPGDEKVGCGSVLSSTVWLPYRLLCIIYTFLKYLKRVYFTNTQHSMLTQIKMISESYFGN